MGVKERKEKEKQQRIDLILKAAEKVFAIKGLDNATVNDVAALAELGKGTLYLYFTNKDDIVFALSSQTIEELFKEFQKAAAKHKKGYEKLRALGVAYMDFCRKHPIKYQLLNFYRVQPLKPETKKEIPHLSHCHMQSQKLFGLMIEIIIEGIQDKTISKHVDPFQTALVLWATTTGIYQMIDTMGEHIQEDHGIAPKKITELYFNLMETALKVYKPT